MRLALAAALLLAAAPRARAADAAQSARDGYGAFLQGRYDDSASAWRYIAGLGVAAPRPEANEALVQRDAGRPESALPLWIKATLIDAEGGFAWNQRAWSNLALGRLREAKESFQKAIDRSSTTATQAEANLGLGLVAILDAKPNAGVEALRRASVSGPYAIGAASLLTARVNLALGDKQAALSYLRQALDVDPYDREALRELEVLLDKIGDNRGAWLTSRRALALDPTDEQARKILARNSSFLVGDPDEAAGVRRIARPLLNAEGDGPLPAVSSRTIRVGLYGAPDGRAAQMTHCYLMMNAPFKVTAAAYGALRDNGSAFDQWEIEYRAETGVVEVRDSARNLLFVSKQPFAFVPQSPRGSVLIKSAKVTDAAGVDIGDREVRGTVEVFPTPWGFRLVEEVGLEEYLFGVVSLALGPNAPPEAYKAQAVVSRTQALWLAGRRPGNPERADLLDDRSTQPTIGVSGEYRSAVDGVLAVEGQVLAERGEIARAPQTEDSGGRTEDGTESGEPGMQGLVSVADAPRAAAPWTTPEDLEHFVHEAPPEGLYSEAAPGPSAATARWTRVLEARDIRARAEEKGKIGRLRGLQVLGRTSTGRVKAIRAIGTDGTADFVGFAAIQRLLSPGSLRSTLFTLQPLYDGKNVSQVVVWGAGTGPGLGFARAGAVGQAALGVGWREILKKYFPNDEIRDSEKPQAKAPVVPKGVGPYKRTLNYRMKPKPAAPPTGNP